MPKDMLFKLNPKRWRMSISNSGNDICKDSEVPSLRLLYFRMYQTRMEIKAKVKWHGMRLTRLDDPCKFVCSSRNYPKNNGKPLKDPGRAVK